MSSIVPFEGSKLPAYLKNVDVASLNADLTSHAGGGFPVISIKGKVFAVVRDGERNIIPNPKDPESPATSIEMVVVKANKGTSKVFYAKGYTEGAENVKPDCFSNDGIKPDAKVENPVHSNCAACPKNAWGSKVSEGGKKIKACSDSVRIAVATVDALNDPYMVRVPPASIRNLGEYGKMLAKKGVAYNMVVTKIGFNPESPTPELTFKPIGFVPDELYPEVLETAASDTVQNILGSVYVESAAPAPAAEQFEQAAPVISKAKAEVPKVATKEKTVSEVEVTAAVTAAAKKETPAPSASIDDINLDDISFDD